MSSDIRTTLEFLQLNNYVSVVLLTVVGYDYLLTFSKEIDYVWCKPWTVISTAFVLIRYLGPCIAVMCALAGSTFAHGLVKMYVSTYTSELVHVSDGRLGMATALGGIWALQVFLATADLMMILRVYAMWSRSRTILAILLLVYVPEIMITFVSIGIYFNPNTHFSVTITQVRKFSVCNYLVDAGLPITIYSTVPRQVLGALLFLLAISQTLKESFHMYQATKRWQPNKYMALLTRDGILYFFLHVLYTISAAIENRKSLTTVAALPLAFLSYTLLCPMMPRFVLSIRALYDRDLRGGFRGVDTGFGMFSQPIPTDTAVTSIVFADMGSMEGLGVASDGSRINWEAIPPELETVKDIDGIQQV